MKLRFPSLLLCLSAALGPVLSHSADIAAAMRVLRDECIGCHKPGKAKGGLLLNTREKMMKGGDNGPAVVPGSAAKSSIFTLALKTGDPHMPPKKQLSAAQMAGLKAWIDSGAEWNAAVFDELPDIEPVPLAAAPASYRPVLALALSPGDKMLAVASGPAISIRDMSKPDLAELAALSGHVEAVQSLAWSADGKILWSGGFRQIRAWDVAAKKETGRISGKLVGNVTALAAAGSGLLFAADGEPGVSGFIHRIDSAAMNAAQTWRAHDDVIYSLRLSPRGDRLLSASADRIAKLWSVADSKLAAFFEGHTNHVLAAVFNQDASLIATGSADREIKVWDGASREQTAILGDKKSTCTALAWTPDGKALIAITDKGTGGIHTSLVRHTGGERSATSSERKLEPAGEMLYSLAVTADGKTIIAGSDGGRLHMWDENGKKKKPLP